jgi:pantothenate kinase-related protein Tda10
VTEHEVSVIVERLDNLIKKTSQDEENAEAWRLRFMDKLDARPCERHSGALRSVDTQLKGLWALVALIIAAVISALIKR